MRREWIEALFGCQEWLSPVEISQAGEVLTGMYDKAPGWAKSVVFQEVVSFSRKVAELKGPVFWRKLRFFMLAHQFERSLAAKVRQRQAFLEDLLLLAGGGKNIN